MKSIISMFLCVTVLMASLAMGGTPAPAIVNPAVTPPAPAATTFLKGFFADISGTYTNQPATATTPGGSSYGGGVSLGYWFMPELGVRLTASFADLKPSAATFSGDLVGRLPLSSDQSSVLSNIAPYLFGGSGFQAINSSAGQVHAGGGVEYKLNQYASIYTEGIYNMSSQSTDTTKPVNVTVGLRLNF